MYSGALSVNATTIVKAIAVAGGYTNSAVTSATYCTISAGSPVSLHELAPAANVYAIGNNATAVTHGSLDTWGYAYSSTLLGSTVSWSGVTFNLGAVGTAARSSTTPPSALPAIGSAALNLLAVAVNGAHRNSFVVTYTDGTTATFTQSLSDWVLSGGNAGESRCGQHDLPDQSVRRHRQPPGLRLWLLVRCRHSTKTVKSLTLPATRNIVVWRRPCPPPRSRRRRRRPRPPCRRRRAPTPRPNPSLSPIPPRAR